MSVCTDIIKLVLWVEGLDPFTEMRYVPPLTPRACRHD
jgi:hypothetical protein